MNKINTLNNFFNKCYTFSHHANVFLSYNQATTTKKNNEQNLKKLLHLHQQTIFQKKKVLHIQTLLTCTRLVCGSRSCKAIRDSVLCYRNYVHPLKLSALHKLPFTFMYSMIF